MALNAAALGAAIYTQLNGTVGPFTDAVQAADMQNLADAIGAAVVAYLVTNTVVTTQLTPDGLVTACPAGAGTCVGAGLGTIA